MSSVTPSLSLAKAAFCTLFMFAVKPTSRSIKARKLPPNFKNSLTRTIVANSPLAALARLQLARAYAVQDDTARAKAAYQDFLTLWKDADPDIPIFIAAKAEYAKL
jgi:hypothetical protein